MGTITITTKKLGLTSEARAVCVMDDKFKSIHAIGENGAKAVELATNKAIRAGFEGCEITLDGVRCGIAKKKVAPKRVKRDKEDLLASWGAHPDSVRG